METAGSSERAVSVHQSAWLNFQEEDFVIIQHCPERATINSSFSLSTSVSFSQLSSHQSLHIRPPAILSMDSGPIADCRLQFHKDIPYTTTNIKIHVINFKFASYLCVCSCQTKSVITLNMIF